MNKHKQHKNYADDWATPASFFNYLSAKYGPFDLDAAASSWSAKCAQFLSKEDDALSCEWPGNRVFLNPPFGRGIERWLVKARQQALLGKIICCVLPSNTDTKWFHEHILGVASEIEFIKGRVQFERPDGAPGRNTTGTVIAIYR